MQTKNSIMSFTVVCNAVEITCRLPNPETDKNLRKTQTMYSLSDDDLNRGQTQTDLATQRASLLVVSQAVGRESGPICGSRTLFCFS